MLSLMNPPVPFLFRGRGPDMELPPHRIMMPPQGEVTDFITAKHWKNFGLTKVHWLSGSFNVEMMITHWICWNSRVQTKPTCHGASGWCHLKSHVAMENLSMKLLHCQASLLDRSLVPLPASGTPTPISPAALPHAHPGQYVAYSKMFT